MTVKLSVNKPGLVQHAKRALLEIERLQDLLSNTTGSHSQATTDAATADAAIDALILTINAL
jgi:hypothetical protein